MYDFEIEYTNDGGLTGKMISIGADTTQQAVDYFRETFGNKCIVMHVCKVMRDWE